MAPLLIINHEKKFFFISVEVTMPEISSSASEPVSMNLPVPAEQIRSIAQRIQELTEKGYREATEAERRSQDLL